MIGRWKTLGQQNRECDSSGPEASFGSSIKIKSDSLGPRSRYSSKADELAASDQPMLGLEDAA